MMIVAQCIGCLSASAPVGACSSAASTLANVESAQPITWYKDVLPMLLSRDAGKKYQCASCHEYDAHPTLVLQEIDPILKALRGQGLALMPRAGDRWPESKIMELEAWAKNPIMGDPNDAIGAGIDASQYEYVNNPNFLQDFNPGSTPGSTMQNVERDNGC